MRDVHADGFDADHELGRDLAVRAAAREEDEKRIAWPARQRPVEAQLRE